MLNQNWLCQKKAMEYLDMKEDTILKEVAIKVRVSAIGRKKYYFIPDIEKLLEANIIAGGKIKKADLQAS